MARKKETRDVHELVKELWRHRNLYYSGTPEISDAEFDALEDNLRKAAPQHKYFEFVGTKASKDSPTVKHRVPMLSMDKVKDTEGVLAWLKYLDLPITTLLSVGPKIDGISGTCRYDEHGKFNYAATRGDGHIGNILKYPEDINGVVSQIPYRELEMEIRGEFYIDQHIAAIEPRANEWTLRNYCYGCINPDRKEKSIDLKYVNFVAYDMVRADGILKGPVSHKYLLDYMRTFLPNVIPQEQVMAIPNDFGVKTFDEYLREYLGSYRDSWPYETDGLILTIDDKRMHVKIDKDHGGAKKYHYFNLAIKPPARNEKTKMAGVDWEVSMHGNVVPTGLIELVVVSGAEFERVTLNNAETVEKLGIGVGSVILLERANDVIPRLVEVVSNEGVTPFEIPKTCPNCGTALNRIGKHVNCPNTDCSGRNISKIMNWVEKNDIKEVGRAVISDLYSSGAVHSIPDLYTIDIDAVLSLIPGYKSGGSKITKINESIQATRGMSEKDIIGRIGIPSIAEVMAEKLKLFSIEDVLRYQANGPYRLEAENKIHEWISDPQNASLLISLRRILGSTVKVNPTVVPKGVNVVITGLFPRERDDIEEELKSKGFNVQSSVNGKTNVLLRGEGSESSGKSQKAEALGVTIMSSLEELYKAFP